MSGDESLASELTCSICLEIYTDPLQLSCLHSYCKKCLEELHTKKMETLKMERLFGGDAPVQKYSIECPDCRMKTVFMNGIDDIRKNFTLTNIASIFKESQKDQTFSQPVILCSLCESDPKPAVRKCRNCSGMNYCVECLQQFHPLRGAFKTHRLCEPEEDIDETAEDRKPGPPIVTDVGSGDDTCTAAAVSVQAAPAVPAVCPVPSAPPLPSSDATISKTPTRRGRHTNQLQYIYTTVLQAVWKHKDAVPFHAAVDAQRCGFLKIVWIARSLERLYLEKLAQMPKRQVEIPVPAKTTFWSAEFQGAGATGSVNTHLSS